jgi:hypothetical protein
VIIRQLEVPSAWVSEGSPPESLELLFGREQTPSDVRAAQGSFVIVFPEIEDQAQRIFGVPGILDWFRELYERVPHASYFLAPSALTGALTGLLLCSLNHSDRAAALQSEQIPLNDVSVAFLTDRMLACAAYATEMGDDWEPIISAFLEPLDDRTRRNVIEGVILNQS